MAKTISIDFITDKINGITVNTSLKSNSKNYTNSSSRSISYIVMHYTGNSKDTAKANANYFNTGSRSASAHFFVDNDNIYQSVELRDIAWHVGSDTYYHDICRNTNSIGIEMCCTAGNYKISEITKENAAYLCAHLCKMIGITASNVDTYVLRHYDVTHKKCPAQMSGSANSEWTSFKTMVKNILNEGEKPITTTTTTTKVLYRIRKDWNDPSSQVGAFYNLESAKKTCDTVGSLYSVYDENGKVVYPVIVDFSDGDQIKLSSDAKYTNGKSIPSWVFEKPLYFRGKDSSGNIKFSTLKTGAITGVVARNYVSKVEVFKPYLAQVITNPLNIRKGAGTNYSIIGKITNKGVYTIIEEANGQGAIKWGLLKSHEKNRDGWIALNYTKKLN